ncbi:MAG: hypothetical protein R3F28_12265 [Candidatus Kapaibacterium sp.]
MRQRPGTAKGTCFIMIEDETGFLQTVVFPSVLERFPLAFRHGALIMRGELQILGQWRGLVVQTIWPLENVIGGYTGFAGADGGRDQRELGEELDSVQPKQRV